MNKLLSGHSVRPENAKIVPVGKSPRSAEVEQMAAVGQKLRESGKRWIDICTELGINTEDGRPNPGLAKRIVDQGYEPKLLATRLRLNLKPLCPTCGQHVKRVRHVPAWLIQAVKNLQCLEAAAEPTKDPIRVYARGGKRVHGARPFTPF